MKFAFGRMLALGIVAGAFAARAELTPEQLKQLPAPATHKIDFDKEIKPILNVSCGNCHGRGKSKGDFRIDNRETFIKGGDSGPAVVVGDSAKSLLIELVMGFDPDAVMPAKGSKLKPEQIALLRAWIDQGVPWDKEAWLGKVEPQNLHPRVPELPARSKFTNPVDTLLDSYFKTNKVKWEKPVKDRLFARRAYLDIIGLLPPADDLNAFIADKSKDKREKLVDKLLNENKAYAEHWLSFWNDLLRNDYKGTGYIDGGRKQITQWLYSSLLTNKPYDQFVAELVNPTPDSEGFTKGIVWRGVVNASQVPPMQAAQNISQVFMGINMKCASCHDSFINDLQLSDAYSLANVYSDEPLELFECDKPTGKMAVSKFLYPEFGQIDNKADKATRMKQLADCVTSEKNGRFPRTLVNRIWDRFFGHPFVGVDDMEQSSWNPDLLDWLAEDFVAHDYDVKHLIKQIVTSRAYQMPSVSPDPNAKQYVFRGPTVRRMTAEQFRDALTMVTGMGYASPNADITDATMLEKYGPKANTKWIWSRDNAAAKAPGELVFFRKTVRLPEQPTDAAAIITCDNSFVLFVNGQKMGDGNDFTKPYLFDLMNVLRPGENVIAVQAANHAANNRVPKPGEILEGSENPAGFYFYARVRARDKEAEKVMDFSTDKTWQWSGQLVDGWETKTFKPVDWKNAFELGNLSMPPWRMRRDLIASRLASLHPGTVRAALVNADSLAVALGRPNREQTVTTRPSEATTLQALELTNGQTLSEIMKLGAANILDTGKTDAELIRTLYQKALGRNPSSGELKLARELLGQPIQKEGVEDLLWATTMLPEFQIIY